MNLSGNTILITGGGSGIGRGLAGAFHQRRNQVIICGWNEGPLREVCERHPGMKYYVMDVSKRRMVDEVAARAVKDFPSLNCVVNNAGLQKIIDFTGDARVTDDLASQEIDINLKGLIYVTEAFLPALRQRGGSGVFINISSGLAFVPLARVPIYCATKAAVHSLCLSLRHQFRRVGVGLIEVIPPAVETNLHRGQGNTVIPNIMQLDDFIAETMKGLESGEEEIAVGFATRLREGSRTNIREVFNGMNR